MVIGGFWKFFYGGKEVAAGGGFQDELPGKTRRSMFVKSGKGWGDEEIFSGVFGASKHRMKEANVF